MGGDGTIGGGKSFNINFNIRDRANRPMSTWNLDDSETGPGGNPPVTYPFNLEFTFPPGTQMVGNTVTMIIRNNGDRVRVRWWT